MQGERLPVPDSPHKMLIYSSGNCSLLICPTRKTLICHYSTMFYSSALSRLRFILLLYHSDFLFLLLFFIPYLSFSLHPRSSWYRSCVTFGMLIHIVFFLFLITKMLKAVQDFLSKTQFSYWGTFMTRQYFRNTFVLAREKKQKGCF